jgi:iron-sulfur cluster assembly accessory protein
MIHLTDTALAAVRGAITRSPKLALGLRIMVETGGCAGYKYMLGLEVEAQEGDALVEQDGVTLFVDEQSQAHVSGMTVDFVESLESSGFVFENPNATQQCGCGKSFC